VRAALATAQATQDAAQPTATALIPKPRGTSGRGNFNLANEMKVDKQICHQIQVRLPFPTLLYPLAYIIHRLLSVHS